METAAASVRVLAPSMCYLFYRLRCDACLLTVTVLLHTTSLTVECTNRTATGAVQTRVLTSEPVPSEEFSFETAVLTPTRLAPLPEDFVASSSSSEGMMSEGEMEEEEMMAEGFEETSFNRSRGDAPQMSPLNDVHPVIINNDSQLPTNCSSVWPVCRRNSFLWWRWSCRHIELRFRTNNHSVAVVVGYLVKTLCSLISMALNCLVLLWLTFRKGSSNDQKAPTTPTPPAPQPEPEPQVEARPSEHVVQWLEDPVGRRRPDPIVHFSEDIQNYRKQMLERAKVYGYKPIALTREDQRTRKTVVQDSVVLELTS